MKIKIVCFNEKHTRIISPDKNTGKLIRRLLQQVKIIGIYTERGDRIRDEKILDFLKDFKELLG